MNDNIKEKAILEALLVRFEMQRLPRLLEINEKVSRGDKLDDYDIEFLEEVFSDTKENKHYVENSDDRLKNIFMKVLSLYNEITEQALKNEQKN